MKKYYAVATTITDKFIKCTLVAIEKRESKPEGSFRSTPVADYYIDWFESADEAVEFMGKNNKNL